MKSYKILLMMLVFCMACIWAEDAYPHGKEKHVDKTTETVAEPKDKGIEEKAAVLPPVSHEGHGHTKIVKTGSFNAIQIGEKQGYNVAVVFAGFNAVVWGLVSFYWRERDRDG